MIKVQIIKSNFIRCIDCKIMIINENSIEFQFDYTNFIICLSCSDKIINKIKAAKLQSFK